MKRVPAAEAALIGMLACLPARGTLADPVSMTPISTTPITTAPISKTSVSANPISTIAVGTAPVSTAPARSAAAALDARLPGPAGARAGTGKQDIEGIARERYSRDLDAMRTYRPGYPFWQHVFTVPDGRIVYGSAADGRLLATFSTRGNWMQKARWEEAALAELADRPVAGGLDERRERTADLIAQFAGPVVHHGTQGSFIAAGVERYGAFLSDWGAIFERFGVPAELGLAQGLVESGLRGRIRSEADAMGFCQWLPSNWERLKKLSPYLIEGYNQTTQVQFCAAYLSILATKYGSFIPALSEHHAGSMNVGRTLINGDFAGGDDTRARYFLGAELTLLVRQIRPPGYREVVGTYGPRSFRYAEMIFGNTLTIDAAMSSTPQERIFAMRPGRWLPIEEVVRRTGMSVDEVRRFNPALVNGVPSRATLYLPLHVEDFGADATFWRRAAAPGYVTVLGDFLSLADRYAPEDWNDPAMLERLRAFEVRFRETGTEEGTVMAVVIAYVIDELRGDRQMQRLAKFRSSERVLRLLEQGLRKRETLLPVADGSAGWARRNAFILAAGMSLQ